MLHSVTFIVWCANIYIYEYVGVPLQKAHIEKPHAIIIKWCRFRFILFHIMFPSNRFPSVQIETIWFNQSCYFILFFPSTPMKWAIEHLLHLSMYMRSEFRTNLNTTISIHWNMNKQALNLVQLALFFLYCVVIKLI